MLRLRHRTTPRTAVTHKRTPAAKAAYLAPHATQLPGMDRVKCRRNLIGRERRPCSAGQCRPSRTDAEQVGTPRTPARPRATSSVSHTKDSERWANVGRRKLTAGRRSKCQRDNAFYRRLWEWFRFPGCTLIYSDLRVCSPPTE